MITSKVYFLLIIIVFNLIGCQVDYKNDIFKKKFKGAIKKAKGYNFYLVDVAGNSVSSTGFQRLIIVQGKKKILDTMFANNRFWVFNQTSKCELLTVSTNFKDFNEKSSLATSFHYFGNLCFESFEGSSISNTNKDSCINLVVLNQSARLTLTNEKIMQIDDFCTIRFLGQNSTVEIFSSNYKNDFTSSYIKLSAKDYEILLNKVFE